MSQAGFERFQRWRQRGWPVAAAAVVFATCVGQLLVGGADLVRQTSSFSTGFLVDDLMKASFFAAVSVLLVTALVLCRGSWLQRSLALATLVMGGAASLFIPFREETIGPCCEGTSTAVGVLPFTGGWWVVNGAFRSVPILLAAVMFGSLILMDRRNTMPERSDRRNASQRAAVVLGLVVGWAATLLMTLRAATFLRGDGRSYVDISRGDLVPSPHVRQVVGLMLVLVVALAVTDAGPGTKSRRIWLTVAALSPLTMPLFGDLGWSVQQAKVFGWDSLANEEASVIGAWTYNELFAANELFKWFALVVGLGVLTWLSFRPGSPSPMGKRVRSRLIIGIGALWLMVALSAAIRSAPWLVLVGKFAVIVATFGSTLLVAEWAWSRPRRPVLG